MSFDLVKEIYYFLLNNTFSTCFNMRVYFQLTDSMNT